MAVPRIARRTILALAAALALSVGFGPATAAGNSVTVAVGGSSAEGSHAVTAASTRVEMATQTFRWTCQKAQVPASPVSEISSGTSVLDVFTVRAMAFVGCSWPGGTMPTALISPATFRVTGPATSGSSDVVHGRLEGFAIKGSYSICDFTATGSVRASLNESTQKLTIEESDFTGNLRISQVRGCLQLVQVGQAMNLSMALQLTSPDGAINISSS
jgi:hypothetical protein